MHSAVIPSARGETMPTATPFAFSDISTFDQNIAEFSAELAKLDAVAGPILGRALPSLANGEQEKGDLLDAFEAALAAPPVAAASSTTTPGQPPSSPSSPAVALPAA